MGGLESVLGDGDCDAIGYLSQLLLVHKAILLEVGRKGIHCFRAVGERYN